MDRDRIIAIVIGIEGGHVDDPRDSGGATTWGITEAVARRHGWEGPMEDLDPDFARRIYVKDYWTPLRLDDVLATDGASHLALELFEAAVHCGPGRVATWLQQVLNILNRGATIYDDITIDGRVGPRTIGALRSLAADGSAEDLAVLEVLLNALQGARYVTLCAAREKNESFLRGWVRKRVMARSWQAA